MTLKEIIIKIDNEAIYFNPSFLVPIQNSNLPNSMKFRSVEEIYWKVELLNYEEDTKCLHLRVLNYKVHEISTFIKQNPVIAIKKIYFAKLDWFILEPQLSSYKEIDLVGLLENHIPPPKPINTPEESFKRSSYLKTELIDNKYPETNAEPAGPIIEQLKLHFSISYKEAIFLNGFVSFKRHVQKLRGKIEFKIQNDYIKEEFDNIKLWFSKKFKSKKFISEVNITIIDGQLSEVYTTSPEIDLITPELIDSVKYSRTIALTKPPRMRREARSLYSLDDIFEQIDSDLKNGNIFNQTEPEILKSLTDKEYVRNRKQLEFLSEKKQSSNSKIYFTLNPLFGFVFLIETPKKYHFTWELLKSHATYLWSIDKNEETIVIHFSKIEQYINEIQIIGRDEYKKEHLKKSTLDGFTFEAIEHQDILTNPKDGFDKWRNKLENILNKI